jgi:hypothetical protein
VAFAIDLVERGDNLTACEQHDAYASVSVSNTDELCAAFLGLCYLLLCLYIEALAGGSQQVPCAGRDALRDMGFGFFDIKRFFVEAHDGSPISIFRQDAK